MISIIASLMEQVRIQNPLVHHITNYVTANDCANITLALGASPIMADAKEEVTDITSMSSALVLNIGTLNNRIIDSAIAAGKAANNGGIPVVLDPVGAGISDFRNKAVFKIINRVKLTAIRGNLSEIKFIAGLTSNTRGVDASEKDRSDIQNMIEIAEHLAQNLKCIVAITGEIDIVSDGSRTFSIKNGHPMLSKVTGTGCMCSSLIGSFCGVTSGDFLPAVIGGILCMGIAGEIAFETAGQSGTGHFHYALHDAISHFNSIDISKSARLKEISTRRILTYSHLGKQNEKGMGIKKDET